jgi:hypothetical protein
MRVAAWQHEGALTPHGRLLVDKCSAEVPNHHDYTITRETHDTFHEYKVRGNHNGSQTQTVCIDKDAMYGCCGLECTCGITQTDGVPCRHVVAIEYCECNAILVDNTVLEVTISKR